jgi:hypothetical protein
MGKITTARIVVEPDFPVPIFPFPLPFSPCLGIVTRAPPWPICLATQTGRPCGGDAFVLAFEQKLRRLLTPQKPAPKPRLVDVMTEDLFS